jgi:hypothetical protein
MKPKHIHQEVLIFTNTTLSRKALCNKSGDKKKEPSAKDSEQASWDVLLNELAHEVAPATLHPKMFIWGIHAGKCYLLIDRADTPGITESIYSIDPHLFSSEINKN